MMSFQSNTINVKEAAKLLNVNRTKVKRYIKCGLLKAKKKSYLGRDYFLFAIDKNNVYSLNDSIKAYDKIKNIKEIFVLNEERRYKHSSIEDFIDKSFYSKDEILKAVGLYSFDRGNLLKQFNVNPEKIFMVGEIAKRLRLNGKHAVYDMIDDGLLKSRLYDGSKNKFNKREGRCFVDKNSYFKYMGKYKGQRVYTSKEVSKNLKWSVCEINKFSKKYKIGRKINPIRIHSMYLFSDSDILKLESRKKDKLEKKRLRLERMYGTKKDNSLKINSKLDLIKLNHLNDLDLSKIESIINRKSKNCNY